MKSIYESNIDGLRAVAVLLVISYHVLPNIIPYGFIGVDIFFVISGYLISGIIFRQNIENRINLKEFYIKRIRRILPTLVVVLVSVIILGFYLMVPNELLLLGNNLIASSLFILNFTLFNEIGYFSPDIIYNPLVHLWSLSIEEQFYIFWPLILILIMKYRTYSIYIICFMLFASFSYCYYQVEIDPVIGFYSPFTRIWELLLGSIIAYDKIITQSKISHNGNLLISLIGVLSILSYIYFFDSNYNNPGISTLLPVIGTALIIFSGKDVWFNKYFLGNNILGYIGKISFPLYLWHWPLLSFLHISVLNQPTLNQKIIMMIIAFFLSCLTFHFVENPIRKQKNISFKFKEKSFITAVLCILIIGIIYKMNDGIPQRFLEENRQIANYTYNYKDGFLHGKCTLSVHQKGKDFSSECISKDKKRVHVLIWGSSLASHIFPGLDKKLDNKIYSISKFAVSGCSPILDTKNTYHVVSENCLDLQNYIAKKVNELKPDILIIPMDNPLHSEVEKNGNLLDIDKILDSATLSKNSVLKDIIIIGPFPNFSKPFPTLLLKESIMNNNKIPKYFDLYDEQYKKYIFYDEYIRKKTKSLGFKYVSRLNSFCENKVCSLLPWGIPAFFDEVHLSDAGSFYLSHFIEYAIKHNEVNYKKVIYHIPDTVPKNIVNVKSASLYKDKKVKSQKHLESAILYVTKNKNQKALDEINLAIKLMPEVHFYSLRANIYGTLGDFKKAYEDMLHFEQNVNDFASKTYAYQTLAQLSSQLKLFNKAIFYNEKLLKIFPKDKNYKQKLKILRTMTKK